MSDDISVYMVVNLTIHDKDDYEPGDTLDEDFYKWGSKYINNLT